MKTPEEVAALRVKYAADNAEKEQKRVEKKSKHADKNVDRNTPVCEIRVPMYTQAGDREVNYDSIVWSGYLDAREELWRTEPAFTQNGYFPEKIYRGPCKRKVIRV